MSDEIVEANAIPHPPTGRSARHVSTGRSAACRLSPSVLDCLYGGPNGRRTWRKMSIRLTAAFLALAAASRAHAVGPTFVVNSTADQHDLSPGDGLCVSA